MRSSLVASTLASVLLGAGVRAQVEPDDPPPGNSYPDVPVNFADSSCDAQKDTIVKEVSYAYQMAMHTADSVTKEGYYDTFFHSDLRSQASFEPKTRTRFSHIADLLSGQVNDHKFTLTCDDSTDGCRNRGWWAHANPQTSRVNLCKKFFETSEDSQLAKTAEGFCGRKNLRYFQRTKAAILIHEMAHLPYAMDETEGSYDIVYGYNGCKQLGEGTYDRSCRNPANGDKKVRCPSAEDPTKDGLCTPDKSAQNADTYSFIAAGVHFSGICGKKIPYPIDRGTTITPPKKRDGIAQEENVKRAMENPTVPADARLLRARRVGVVVSSSKVERNALFSRAECPEDDGVDWDSPGENEEAGKH